jgi:hypothetical protein
MRDFPETTLVAAAVAVATWALAREEAGPARRRLAWLARLISGPAWLSFWLAVAAEWLWPRELFYHGWQGWSLTALVTWALATAYLAAYQRLRAGTRSAALQAELMEREVRRQQRRDAVRAAGGRSLRDEVWLTNPLPAERGGAGTAAG